LSLGVPPLFCIGPSTLHWPQLGDAPAQPLTFNVSAPLLITLLSCDWPLQPVSRSAASPFASNWSDVGQPPAPGVGVAAGPVAVAVATGVAVTTGVAVATGVAVTTGVAVAVVVAVGTGVTVAVTVATGVAVRVGTAVTVATGVLVATTVGVAVAGGAVAVTVGVCFGFLVRVGFGVAVGFGFGAAWALAEIASGPAATAQSMAARASPRRGERADIMANPPGGQYQKCSSAP